eukprot:1144409-Pelagomonas_calceolata.AAC.9
MPSREKVRYKQYGRDVCVTIITITFKFSSSVCFKRCRCATSRLAGHQQRSDRWINIAYNAGDWLKNIFSSVI